MSDDRHFTTRRGFVGAMGFGALGLYATWAAYGASPLPFSVGASPMPSGQDGHGGGHDGPTVAEASDATRLTPAEFEKRHADFVRTHRHPDGSVHPAAPADHDDANHGVAPANTGHDRAGAMPTDHAGHTPAATDVHGGHAANTVSMSGGHAGSVDHAAPATATTAEHVEAPIQVYLSAGRFAFEPDDLRLEKGRTYRFHMMATDVAHGASIALGSASRIVRLRPDTVTTLDLTFLEKGHHLVYCTVHCGPGHDAMHASITVA